jgi:hypothetical protein
MDKKELSYVKNYKGSTKEIGTHLFTNLDKNDIIDSLLEKNYLVLSKSNEESNYLAYLTEGIFKINSLKEKIGSHNYKRVLKIEMMPKTLNLPSDLERTLKEKGFTRVRRK